MKSKKFIGLRIATVGFLCVVFGFVLFLLKAQLIGRLILYLGFIVVFVGILTNFYILVSKVEKRK